MRVGRLKIGEECCRLPWRVDEIVRDFHLLDVWGLPASGGLEDFPELCSLLSRFDAGAEDSPASRGLFALRAWLGKVFAWDEASEALPIPGCLETSLVERLPADLRGSVGETKALAGGFRPVFRSDQELALEVSNATVHAVLHLRWVEQGKDRYQGQMGVYVKTRGWLGPLYMAAISPFRHYIVYPALLKRIDKYWKARPQSQAA